MKNGKTKEGFKNKKKKNRKDLPLFPNDKSFIFYYNKS